MSTVKSVHALPGYSVRSSPSMVKGLVKKQNKSNKKKLRKAEEAKEKTYLSQKAKVSEILIKKKMATCEKCLICEKAIKDATAKSKGQDSIHCSGWMHRLCAGIPLPVFKALSENVENPFLCLYCSNTKILQLLQTVQHLSREVESLKSSNAESVGNSQTLPVPYSSVVERNTPDKLPNKISRSQSNPSQVPNRKFNLVVFGVKEKPKGSPKHTRLIEDIKDVSVIFNNIDVSIKSQSVQDCIRLGKYSEEKCRPLLVKCHGYVMYHYCCPNVVN